MQSVLIIFAMGVYFILCIKIKPYKTKKLNFLSIFSIITIIFSVGIKSNVGDDSKINIGFKTILDIIIFISNIAFVLYFCNITLFLIFF